MEILYFFQNQDLSPPFSIKWKPQLTASHTVFFKKIFYLFFWGGHPSSFHDREMEARNELCHTGNSWVNDRNGVWATWYSECDFFFTHVSAISQSCAPSHSCDGISFSHICWLRICCMSKPRLDIEDKDKYLIFSGLKMLLCDEKN